MQPGKASSARGRRPRTKETKTIARTALKTVISVMLAVPDTQKAVRWYKKALGARLLWSLGSVVGLEIDGAPFFLHPPVEEGFACPNEIRTRTARVELFVEHPDRMIARAIKAGATGGGIKDHIRPWGTHRQGG